MFCARVSLLLLLLLSLFCSADARRKRPRKTKAPTSVSPTNQPTRSPFEPYSPIFEYEVTAMPTPLPTAMPTPSPTQQTQEQCAAVCGKRKPAVCLRPVPQIPGCKCRYIANGKCAA